MAANPWILAARPKTLPAAMTPVVVGSATALADDVFRWDAFIAALVGALAIQVAANFANDASDASRGTDDNRVGPTRVVASGILSAKSVWIATWVAVAVATLAGVYLIAIAGWVVAAIGVTSVVAMLGYVGGPIPYGYRGLGEVFVFVFFGLVATVGSRYVHDMTAPADAWGLAVTVGLLITAILVANNLRDLETDAAAGKRTLAVMMGSRATIGFFRLLVWGAFALLPLYVAVGIVPLGALLGILAVPLAIGPSKDIARSDEPQALLGVLASTARLQLVLGVLVSIGINLSLG